MKILLLMALFVVGCSSQSEIREEQQEDRIEQEEMSRTGGNEVRPDFGF